MTLQSLSLVDKRCYEANRTFLFDTLDLSKRDASELVQLHSDLLKGAGDAKKLGSNHIGTLTVEMLEDCCNTNNEGDSEFGLRHRVVVKCLDDMASIGTCELEVSISDSPEEDSWKTGFVPASEELSQKLARKTNKLELSINFMCKSLRDEYASRSNTNKVTRIIRSFTLPLLQSLHLCGIGIDKDDKDVTAVINSPHLRSLTLMDCWGDFSAWRPSCLRTLTIIWRPSRQDKGIADLPLALHFMAASADTLESIVLKKINAINYSSVSSKLTTQFFRMPQLLNLQLVDSHFGQGSLLEVFLPMAETPVLRKLDLGSEEDILDANLSATLDKLPSLRMLCLSYLTEGGIRSASEGAGLNYSVTKETCRKHDIQLEIECWILRCDDWQELLSIVAEDIVCLSVSSSTAALLKLETANTLNLPKLRDLTIGIRDLFSVPKNPAEPELGGLEIPSLKSLIHLFEAPLLRELGVTLLTTDNCAPPKL